MKKKIILVIGLGIITLVGISITLNTDLISKWWKEENYTETPPIFRPGPFEITTFTIDSPQWGALSNGMIVLRYNSDVASDPLKAIPKINITVYDRSSNIVTDAIRFSGLPWQGSLKKDESIQINFTMEVLKPGDWTVIAFAQKKFDSGAWGNQDYIYIGAREKEIKISRKATEVFEYKQPY